MKQVDIKELEVKIDITKILNALSLNKEIEIDINGNIYFDESCDLKIPLVFKLSAQKKTNLLQDSKSIILNLFKDYKPEVNGTDLTIKPLMAWQEIIFLNQPRMLYFDHQTDGVELFEDKRLEDIGWHATACDISYREISSYIESNCEGILVFYDNKIQFNGFVLVNDIEDVRIKVEEFIIKKISLKIEDDLLDIEDDDVLEALEYFNIRV